MRCRVDGRVFKISEYLTGNRVEVRDLLDLVAEHRHPVGGLGVDRLNLKYVAAHPKPPALKHHVVALVLHLDEALEEVIPWHLCATLQQHKALAVPIGRSHSVDARHRRHDHHITPGQERGRGRVPQAVDLVVDRGVFLDVRIARRDVCLGLVVVVVRDEVLHRRPRQVLAELIAQLCGQSLVVGNNERGPTGVGDEIGHREGLAGTGHPKQRLVTLTSSEPFLNCRDGVRLIAGGQMRIGDCVRGGSHTTMVTRLPASTHTERHVGDIDERADRSSA